MAGLALTVSPGFVLLAAALYFLGGTGALAAFLAAALAHELGHLTGMFLTGASVRGIRITACGPVIEYSGALTAREEIGIVAAGPLAGVLFAALCFLTDAHGRGTAGAVRAGDGDGGARGGYGAARHGHAVRPGGAGHGRVHPLRRGGRRGDLDGRAGQLSGSAVKREIL